MAMQLTFGGMQRTVLTMLALVIGLLLGAAPESSEAHSYPVAGKMIKEANVKWDK